MTVTINGSTGIDKVAAGAIEKADLPAGTVLQVVQALSTTAFSTSSTTPVSTGFSASITPLAATSKILCLFNGRLYMANAANEIKLSLYRNGVQLFNGATLYNPTTGIAGAQGFQHLDSPATTSPVTYSIYLSSTNAGQAVQFMPGSSGDTGATLTLMEIAA